MKSSHYYEPGGTAPGSVSTSVTITSTGIMRKSAIRWRMPCGECVRFSRPDPGSDWGCSVV